MHYTQYVTASVADDGLHFRSSPSFTRMATAALSKLVDATLRGTRALVKCDRWRVAPLEFDVFQCVSYYCYSSFRRGRGQNDALMLLQQPDFASLVARQRDVSDVPIHAVCSIMSARITKTVESVPVSWSDVLVMDCFFARFVSYQLEKTKNTQQQQRQGQTAGLATMDEDAISSQPEWIVKIIPRLTALLLQTPTVWTVVAALGVLVSAHIRKGLKIPDDIEQIAARVPGEVPNFVCEDIARRFDEVVKDVSHDLIKALHLLGIA